MTTLSDLRKVNSTAVPPEIALVKPGYESNAAITALQRLGRMFSNSDMVPVQFRGEANLGNTSIALEMALRMQASPMMVLQNMYMVQGRPGWSTQFLIACFNQTGRFSSLRYEFEGQPYTDGWGCRASATELSTGEKVTGTLVTIGIAKQEGWYGKNGSKWRTMPEQMLRYRAAAWFIRSVAPEVAMGMYTVDELRDIERADAAYTVPVQQVQQAQPVQQIEDASNVEPEQEQPKKRGRKTKAQPAPEQIEEAEEVAQGPSVLKSETRRQFEDHCANFDDFPADPDAVMQFVQFKTGKPRVEAEKFFLETPGLILAEIRDNLRQNLPTWDEVKANSETVLTKAEIAANIFGINLSELIPALLSNVQPEQRQAYLNNVYTQPEAFLKGIGDYIRK